MRSPFALQVGVEYLRTGARIIVFTAAVAFLGLVLDVLEYGERTAR